MKILKINIVDANEDLFLDLEKKELIKLFVPKSNLMNLPENKNFVDCIYTTDEIYGSHKLICVAINSTIIKLNYHPDNEDFILINNTKMQYKPLYLILGLYKQQILQEKIFNNTLNENDLIAIKLVYNDPLLSFFTMLKETVHCEITIQDNTKTNPIFFVSEPTNLKQIFLPINDYQFELKHTNKINL